MTARTPCSERESAWLLMARQVRFRTSGGTSGARAGLLPHQVQRLLGRYARRSRHCGVDIPREAAGRHGRVGAIVLANARIRACV